MNMLIVQTFYVASILMPLFD